ncbi:MAG: BACON domain-containing protein [Prevotella sp.]|nr:BACON domain-containing protein [Prevotella sp.]
MNIMKRSCYHLYNRLLSAMLMLLGFSISAGFTACMYGAEYGPDPNFYDLDVDPQSLQFDYEEGQEGIIKISTSGDWTITHKPSFLNVSSTNGQGTNIVYVITTETNNSSSSRQDYIIVEGGENYKRVSVTQTGKPKE